MLSLSKSKLGTWSYCPASFYRQYILGLDAYNPKFEFGGDMHKWIEMYHKRQTKDFVRHYSTGEILEPRTEIVRNDEAIKPYTDIYPVNYFDVTPDIKIPHDEKTTYSLDIEYPALVERRYKIYLVHPYTGERMKLPMSLVIDGIRYTDKRLCDHKTTSNAWNQGMADRDIQATIYLFAWWQMTGELWEFGFTPIRKKPGPRTKPIQDMIITTRTVEDFATAWDEINETAEEIVTARRYPCYCKDRRHEIKGITT